MNTLNFENLPSAVADLKKGQSEILALLSNKAKPEPEADNPQNIDEVAKLTGYTKPTLYGYCQNNAIPYHKKNGRLFFFKSEIIDWIRTGKQKTLKELEADTDNFLSNHKKGFNNDK